VTLIFLATIAYHQYSVMDEMQPQSQQVTQVEESIKQKELSIANINQQKSRYSQMLSASAGFKPNQRFTYKLLEHLIMLCREVSGLTKSYGIVHLL